MSEKLKKATLGGGCFWCVEAIYQDVQGIIKLESGYAGGHVADPTYRAVCNGTTGHAEVIQLTYDADQISFEDILYIFWRTHDPTTMDRQGNDVGTQYRSIILYHDAEQKSIAERSKAETDANQIYPSPIVTEIVPLDVFYAAEDYHQDYYKSNPYQPYCMAVIDPKVRKFRKSFQDKLKTTV